MPALTVSPKAERTERLEARITHAQKALLRQAAELQGRSLSEFVVQAASEAAARAVREQQLIELTAQEQASFVEMLLNPPKPNARLRAAARLHAKVIQ